MYRPHSEKNKTPIVQQEYLRITFRNKINLIYLNTLIISLSMTSQGVIKVIFQNQISPLT